jgi:hypothetical protein
MPKTPLTAMRLTGEDHKAIDEIAHSLRDKGVLGLFTNDGEVITTAVIRYTLQHYYMEVKREQKEAAKSQSSSSDES